MVARLTGRRAAALGAVVVALIVAAPAPRAAANGPALSARAAFLLERDTGTVIYSRNASLRRPIASTTKMMTALVAVAHASLDRVLTVQPYSPQLGETLAGLAPGERLSVADLIRAMLLPSGGDAAHSLAVDIGGTVTRFVGWMNVRARSLHLRNTHYATPVGLDTPGNYSTAADLARIGAAVMDNPFLARTVAMTGARLSDGRWVVNRNRLVGRHGFVVGVKTGHTGTAGHCLVGAATRDGANVISVVLGEPSEAARDADTLALLRYGLGRYRAVDAATAGRVYARLQIAGYPDRRLDLVAARSSRLVIRRGLRLNIYLTGVPIRVTGPLPAGTRLGEIDVRLAGRLIARVPLVGRVTVPAPPPPPPPPPAPPAASGGV